MYNIVIRKANINDLYDVQKLNNELFKIECENYDNSLIENWPLSREGAEYFSDEIINNIVLVACVNEQIVGYLAGTLNSQYSYNNNIQAELDNMCILKKYRNLGIGRKLFDVFKNICKENKVDEIKVIASYENIDAIEFYKRNNFKESEITLKCKLD